MEINTKEDLLNILQGFQEKFDAMEVTPDNDPEPEHADPETNDEPTDEEINEIDALLSDN